MLRRLLALGGALIALIVIVLGVKGCLDAQARGALSDYSRSVRQILVETEQSSKRFFGLLEDPGTLSVTEFTGKVEAERSAMTNLKTRVEGLSAPGALGSAQNSLELVYTLRAAAMEKIAEKMPTALGEAGAAQATTAITKQMQTLLASDVIYESVVRPEINNKLSDEGIEGHDVPKSTFVPDGTKWLEEGEVAKALGTVSGSSGGEPGPGLHGLGLVGTSVNGTELSAESTTSVTTEGTPEVEVTVQNQGESTENGVTVVVIANGKETTQEIAALEAAAEETAVVPLTPAPEGETKLEVQVEPVPGEQFTQNNEATYTVVFE
ncbi:MAG: hypothetical protein JST08_21550 [Actinobacteria bacterium]|nr:hypothetical protein [Actinomycetota bacterium]